jgi:hypothetical protein
MASFGILCADKLAVFDKPLGFKDVGLGIDLGVHMDRPAPPNSSVRPGTWPSRDELVFLTSDWQAPMIPWE